MYIYVYVYIYIYTYTHTYIHIYICIHICMLSGILLHALSRSRLLQLPSLLAQARALSYPLAFTLAFACSLRLSLLHPRRTPSSFLPPPPCLFLSPLSPLSPPTSLSPARPHTTKQPEKYVAQAYSLKIMTPTCRMTLLVPDRDLTPTSSINTATHCNTLQHAATHCSTLQHTAKYCL